jgi:hypothetical protein
MLVGGECFEVAVVVRDVVERRTLVAMPGWCGEPRDQRPSGGELSADGRYATFTTALSDLVPGDTNDVDDVFRRDVRTSAVVRLSVAADGSQLSRASTGGSMSAGAGYVTFSTRSAAVPGDTNGVMDVYGSGPLP